VSFSPLKHVAVSELEDIVDPTGKNLTFSDAAAIIGRANDWLIPAQRNRIRSLTPSDQDLIDTARAIRNFIAHGSTGSKKIMNDALATVDRHGRNPHLDRGQNKVHDEGAYLKAVFNGHRRIATYTSRFKEIAAKM
jgi:hypothetical protein